MKIYQLFIILAFASIVLNPVMVFAQAGELPQYNQGVDQSIKEYLCTPTGDGSDLERCINRLYRFGITAGALILVAMVVIAGYLYITGGETAKGKAKSMLLNSLTGMAILLGSYALLYFINPSLVAFRPIQPPIFDAEDMPSCSALGLGDDCVIHGIETETATATSAGAGRAGTAVACRGGIISMPPSIPRTQNVSRICKDLADKLVLLKSRTTIPWIVTSTIRSGGAQSSCHGGTAPTAGNCADIQVDNTRRYPYNKNSGGSQDPRWGDFCVAVNGLGGVNFANEASNTEKCQSIRAYRTYQYTSGPHLHVNYIGG